MHALASVLLLSLCPLPARCVAMTRPRQVKGKRDERPEALETLQDSAKPRASSKIAL